MSDRQTSHIEMLRGIIESRRNENRKLRDEIVGRDKKIAELRALVEIIKEVDARFGHFRELKGLNESGPSEALAEVADIIHRAAEAAGSETTG